MTPSKVYIPQNDGRFDLSDAARFGALVTVFRHDLYPDNVDDEIVGATAHAGIVLRNFDFDHDYLMLVGSPLYQAICCVVLGLRMPAPAKLRVLRYDRIERGYYEVPIPHYIEENAHGGEEDGQAG